MPLVRHTSSLFSGVSPYQWLVLFVAWLGWVFDSMDATIYAMVLHPALSELLSTPGSAIPTPDSSVAWYGGIILSIFLIGWALGGVAFGIIADRIGRTRTLAVTIAIYAVFTGCAALSRDWWHLAIYRFLTALGIGGEWAAGATIVAEVWPEEKRAKAAGILQSAWAVGFFLAAALNLCLSRYGWRILFVVGIAPAFVALLVRLWVKEPERWLAVHTSGRGTGEKTHRVRIGEIFKGELRKSTCIGSALAFVAVFGLWGATNWTPTLVTSLEEVRHLERAAQAHYVSYAVMALNIGAFIGYLGFVPLADRLGRRPAFAIMCGGSLVMLPVIFLVPHSFLYVLVLLPMLGFFNNGIFSGFPIYLPELYPTRLRATGAGFCFNAGRVFAAGGPFITGALVNALGTFGRAASAVGLMYLVGLVVVACAPETRGKTLPE